MAKLPTEESLGPRPTPEPQLGLARYQPISGKETAPGEAMTQLGSTMEKVGDEVAREQTRLNTIQAEDAWNKLRERELDLTYNPETGYTTVKGANAVNQPLLKDYSGRLADAAKSIADTLPNDQAKEMFTRRAAVSSISLKDGILRHQATQADAFARQTLEGAVKVELENSARNWGDPQQLAQSQTRIDSMLDAEGRRTGEAADLVKSQKTAFKSQQYTAVINQALAVGNYQFARLVYEQNKGILNPAIVKSFQPFEAKSIADDVVKSIMTGPSLTGVGADPADPTKVGLVGDPQVLADQINQFVNADDRKEALDQLRRQAVAPGGMAMVQRNKVDIMGRLAEAFDKAAQISEKRYPGDPVMLDMVTTQLKGYVSNLAQAQAGIAKKAADTLVGIAISPTQPTTFSDLLAPPGAMDAWDKLDMESRKGLMGLLEHNARAARGEFTRSDPKVLTDLYARIQLPEGDPNRISNSAQLMPFYAKGLNPTDGDRMAREITAFQTPEGNPFLREKQAIRSSGHRMLTGSMIGQIQPDVAEEAWVRWGQGLDAKIEQYRKDNKDPRELWQATVGGKPNPDYVLAPAYVQSFMPTATGVVAQEAARRTAAAAKAIPYETALPAPEEAKFQEWKKKWAPNDSGADYDLRGAFKAGITPGKDGHWPDQFKKPNHPTFSTESQYATGAAKAAAGKWDGDVFVPPKAGVSQYSEGVVYRFTSGDYRYKGGNPKNPASFEKVGK